MIKFNLNIETGKPGILVGDIVGLVLKTLLKNLKKLLPEESSTYN